MKELKIFSWSSFALAVACLLISCIEDFEHYWSDWNVHWKLAALIFVLAAILSLLVTRALKQNKEELDLKMLIIQ